jgi:hypothetical protein
LNLRRITSGTDNTARTPFPMDKYLLQRGDTRVKDWASFVVNAKFFADSLRSGSENQATVNSQDIRATSGIDRLKLVLISRLVADHRCACFLASPRSPRFQGEAQPNDSAEWTSSHRRLRRDSHSAGAYRASTQRLDVRSQMRPAGHGPQSSSPPQPSEMRAQAAPCASQVVGAQPHWFTMPPPPQVCGATQLPQSTNPPHPSATLPQRAPTCAHVAA